MDRESKTVSVIVTTSADVSLVDATVTSVLTQSHRQLEAIVVDDGSSGAVTETLAAIADERLTHLRHGPSGRAAALNAALQRARGHYIAFLAAGDRFLPDKLATQVYYLEEHPAVAMVYTPRPRVDDPRDCFAEGWKAAATSQAYPEIGFGAPTSIPLSTLMIRREALDAVGGFDERLEYLEDADLWRRMIKRYRAGAIAEPVAVISSDADDAMGSKDPTAILGAFAYYADKALRDDGDIDPFVRGAGIRRLGEYAAASVRGNSPRNPYADLLQQQARRHFQPKVSIVIPVYNGANFLGEAIRSALSQTYDNVEIVVVNDGSTDGGPTERVARAFGDRIRYFSKPNGGVATALNRGIQEMTGDYFSWLSHDDLYLPDKLSVQIEALAQMPDPRRCILYSDYGVFTADPEAAAPYVLPHVSPQDFRYFITTANGVHGCTLLVPREAFAEHGGFDPALRTTQDYDLWFRMAATFAFVHQSAILVRARSHPAQGTHELSHLVLGECNALLKGFVGKLSEAEVRQDATVSLADGYFRLASNLARRGFSEASELATELGRRQLVGPDLADGRTTSDQSGTEGLALRLSAEVALLSRQADALRAEVQDCQQELEEIYRSRSWRVTVPLRYLGQKARRLIGRIVR